MTEGTSKGIFIVIAIVIFGIFIGIVYTVFGSTLSNGVVGMFESATDNVTEGRSDEVEESIYPDKNAVPNEQGDFTFVINDDEETATITRYIGTKDSIVVPHTYVEDGKSYIVSALGNSSLSYGGDNLDSYTITKIMLPNTIVKIDSFAMKANSLTSINLPESLTYLGIEAFQNNSITEITIPKGLTDIDARVFSGNPIEKVYGTDVNDPVFKQRINPSSSGYSVFNWGIPTTAQYYFSHNDYMFDETTGTLTKYFGYERDIVVPESINGVAIEHIGVNTYVMGGFSIAAIDSVVLHENIKTIGGSSFRYNNLSSLQLPDSLVSIGTYAFSNNTNLTYVEIPNGTTYATNSFRNTVTVIQK